MFSALITLSPSGRIQLRVVVGMDGDEQLSRHTWMDPCFAPYNKEKWRAGKNHPRQADKTPSENRHRFSPCRSNVFRALSEEIT